MPTKKARVNNAKSDMGQFFTRDAVWLQPQVRRFIEGHLGRGAMDPYAGAGHLLDVAKELGAASVSGMEIDAGLCAQFGWRQNDSLRDIPATGKIIITNPPYLAKNSAKRLDSPSYAYFAGNAYEDLYQLALEKMLAHHDAVVAIIPETFLISGRMRERLERLTVLEDNPFEDTDLPVCVVCFVKEPVADTAIYKNDQLMGSLRDLEQAVPEPHRLVEMIFNDRDGNIGLRAVDNPGRHGKPDRMRFCEPADLGYPVERIVPTSRAITLISVALPKGIGTKQLVEQANLVLNRYRSQTGDLFLCPFKGNTHEGVRRRRLDYRTARALLERALVDLGAIVPAKLVRSGKRARQSD